MTAKWLLAMVFLGLLLVGCPSAPPPDTQNPTVSISTPPADGTVDNPSLSVSGSASDDRHVASVSYSVNGGPEQAVSITPGTSASFSFNVSLSEGVSTTITVIARDSVGHQASASRTVTFVSGSTPEPSGISGYVTNANASEPVSGTNIEVRNAGTTTVVATTTTDASGRYSVNLPAGTYDLVLSKPGYAGSRVLGAKVSSRLHLNIVQQKAFNPAWPTTPPDVSIGQVDEGEVYDGALGVIPYSVTSSPTSPLGTHVIYAALGHTPGSTFATGLREAWFETNSTGQQYIDPLDYGVQGNTTFEVVVYDYNYNRTHVIRNIKVSYPFADHADLVAPEAQSALAVTTSKQITFAAAPAGGNLYVELFWKNLTDFSKFPNDLPFGCKVYRSFDGHNFIHIRTLRAPCTFYRDSSADLEVGKKTYYRITTFVGDQESPPSNVVSTTPLPPWDVRLTAPADDAQNVSNTPTFTWTKTASVGAHQYYAGALWDTLTGQMALFTNPAQLTLVDQTSWTWNQDGAYTGSPLETLQKGRSYEWQIILAYALDDPLNPTAVSVAADGLGFWTLGVESTDFFTFTTAP